MDSDLKDDKNSANDEAISSCAIFYERLPNQTDYKCPRGQCFFEASRARPIQKLVIGAARHLGHHIPDLSFFQKAELFYQHDTLVEARVYGHYAIGINDEGGLEVKDWTTPEKPLFTFNAKHGIRPDPSDKGKAYIAVFNRGIGALVRWNLSSQYGRERRSEADHLESRPAFRLRKEVQHDPEPLNRNEVSASEIRKRVQNLDPDSLYRVLLPEQPINAHELMSIKLSDPHRMLLYLVDKSRVEYDLAMLFARSQSCDRKLLDEFVALRGVTVEQAKVLWARQQLTEQAVFVRDTLAQLHEKNGKTLVDVFEQTLGQSLYQAAFAEWTPLYSKKLKDVKEIKKPLLRQEIESAKKRLGLPGRGRRSRTGKELKDLRASRERLIRDAVVKLSKEAKRLKKNVVVAEDMMTPQAVAAKIGKHVSTLYRWLRKYDLDFADIRNDGLRRAGFRT